jgi:cation:H+ antiporter
VGFWVLLKGADLLVAGAVSIAQRTGLSPAVIGATVVAFGTSLPELVVSVVSSVQANVTGETGRADIAISNVVGSNIFNIGAILGISALMRRLPVPASSLRLDYPLMVAAFVFLVLFSIPWDGGAGRIYWWQGAIFVGGLIAFTVMSVKLGKVDTDEVAEAGGDGRSVGSAIGLIVIGILMLAGGGEVTLTGAVKLAELAGMTERVIGLTVVAIGTSLPELATSIQSARKGHTEIAVANVIGSNIFNVLCIVGVASLILELPVNRGTVGWDYLWMMGFAIVLLPMMLSGRVIGRPAAVVLLVMLVTYVTLLIVAPSLSILPAG